MYHRLLLNFYSRFRDNNVMFILPLKRLEWNFQTSFDYVMKGKAYIHSYYPPKRGTSLKIDYFSIFSTKLFLTFNQRRYYFNTIGFQRWCNTFKTTYCLDFAIFPFFNDRQYTKYKTLIVPNFILLLGKLIFHTNESI